MARKKASLIEAKPKRQLHRQINLVEAGFGEVFDQAIEPRLPPQHPEHQFMTKRAVVLPHFPIETGQEHRSIRAFQFHSPQYLKRGATCRRSCHAGSASRGVSVGLPQRASLAGAEFPSALTL